jgi:polyketide synthase 12
VDVVLNALAGEFTDASLRLLGEGGRFLEMGKTDIRSDPGVWYRAFDVVGDAGPDLIGRLLGRLRALFAEGALEPLPVTPWPLGRAREAMRVMSRAGHIGKVVLEVPPAFDPDGTVLISGGTGALGAAVAEHVVGAWGARHLVLASRRGLDAPGARELADRLRAEVRVVEADMGDPAAVAELVAGIDPAHPLTGVVHAAGVIDDALAGDITPDRLRGVWRPKADALVNLHAATADLRLGVFVVLSSAAATLGSPGQANYAAANAYCDAFMARRRAAGLPGVSIGWGLWEQTSGMTGRLTDADLARMRRGGLRPLTTEHALALLDAAVGDGRSHLIASDLDTAALAAAPAEAVPAVLRELAAGGVHRRTAASAQARPGELAARLAGVPPAERRRVILALVRDHAAAALGHSDAGAIDPQVTFKDLGFDSLTGVELRNRLSAVTGLRLPPALVFDYPDPVGMADHLDGLLAPDGSAGHGADTVDSVLDEVARLEGVLAAVPGNGFDPEAITARLEALLAGWKASRDRMGGDATERLEAASADQVLEFIDNELGLS